MRLVYTKSSKLRSYLYRVLLLLFVIALLTEHGLTRLNVFILPSTTTSTVDRLSDPLASCLITTSSTMFNLPNEKMPTSICPQVKWMIYDAYGGIRSAINRSASSLHWMISGKS